MAKLVLASWGIRSTSDFGEIVYNLIRIGKMSKSDDDRREDFDDVYDFEQAFVREYSRSPRRIDHVAAAIAHRQRAPSSGSTRSIPTWSSRNRAEGATGATSNPIIISDLIKTGRFDERHRSGCSAKGSRDEEVAWQLTDQLVRQAQEVFLPVWEQTKGNDGYVSFELDPLLEDPAAEPAARRAREALHRAGQEVVGRAQEPDDQGAGHAGGPRRARRRCAPRASRST